ncbi:MAG TPA: glycosyltransferase family 39 protein [Bordetella sp.]
MRANSGLSQSLAPPSSAAPSSASWRDALAARFSLDAVSLQPLVLLLLGLQLLLWTVLLGLSHSAPDVDNMEELIWGNVFQWGYYKHPPLPSWVHYGLITLFGRQVWITFFAGQLSVTLALYFIWRLGCEMTSQRNALLAVLLMMPIAYFTTRGVMSNHNTIQLWSVAGAIWMFYRAWRYQQLRDWLLLGVFSALAMLTKYSAGVWFVMFALQLLASGSLRELRTWKGVLAGACVLAVMLLPHAMWLYNMEYVLHNPANPLTYATVATRTDSMTRASNLLAIYYVFTTTLARIAPMLLAMLIIGGLLRHAARRRPAGEAGGTGGKPGSIAAQLRPQDRRFILMLGLGPFVLTCAASFIADTWMIADWTTTFFLMAGLLTFWLYAEHGGRRLLKTSLAVVGVMQVLTVVGYAAGRGPLPSLMGRPTRSNFPSSQVSRQLQQVWHDHVDGPLRFIAADTWIGGNIAIHAGRQAQVLIDGDPQNTPWIDPGQLAACGMLVVIDASPFNHDPVWPLVAERMKQAQWQGIARLPATRNANGPQVTVDWGIVPPTTGCKPAP